MNHAEAYERLNDYVDGSLDAAARVAVDAHLPTCESCRSEAERIASLVTSLHGHPRTIEPERDLWPSIGARLGSRGMGSLSLWSARYVLAAAALLLIAVSATVTLWLAGAGSELATEPTGAGAYTQFLETELHYVRAVDALEEALAVSTGNLAPETMALIEKNLRIIDAAIRETRAALAADPASADIAVILSGVYRTKLEVLRQANRMAAG